MEKDEPNTTLTGRKVLVTGATGMVAEPIALALAGDNDVWAVARFTDSAARERLERGGVSCQRVDLAADDLSELATDFDHVLHFAVQKRGDFDSSLTANAEALGLLMMHCRNARSFLHCSSTAVYRDTEDAIDESYPLGDNHGVIMPTYSIAKIAAEAVARTAARQFGLPTTIARLNVPYSDTGGWPAIHLDRILAGGAIPLHDESPCAYSPIHVDDMLRTLPGLLAAASVPATIVNWGGPQRVTIEEWCRHLASLAARDVEFTRTNGTLRSVVVDIRKLEALAGPCEVDWRDGMRRLVEARSHADG
jgi:nucleoside-diphosphate-sugar epimerase